MKVAAMKHTDKILGMDRAISRRDLLHGVAAGLAGALLPGLSGAEERVDPGAQDLPGYYPPGLTGLRGSHPGSFETAHALALGQRRWPAPALLDEYYDLVVVGAGISGLTAAYEFLRQRGPDAPHGAGVDEHRLADPREQFHLRLDPRRVGFARVDEVEHDVALLLHVLDRALAEPERSAAGVQRAALEGGG